jgi:hypothetical protein
MPLELSFAKFVSLEFVFKITNELPFYAHLVQALRALTRQPYNSIQHLCFNETD